MLVLSRKKDEVVLIGNDISIQVVDIRGDSVRLGFTAPLEQDIDREEVRIAKLRDGARSSRKNE